MAAALAVEGARRGRRTVVVTIDPAKRLADALGLDSLTDTPRQIDGDWPGELWALMLDPRSTFDGLVERYAPDAEQAEAILANRFYRNIAGALSGTQAALRGITRAGLPTRRRVAGALRSVLPSSGYGPAADRLEGWKWHMSLRARTTGGHELGVEVDSEGHVGYLATARMMGEAGLLLAEQGATPERAGCLTPATALGTDSLERFERARLRFSVAA